MGKIVIPTCGEKCPALCEYELDNRTNIARQAVQLVESIVNVAHCHNPKDRFVTDGMEGFTTIDCTNPNMRIAQEIIELVAKVQSKA